MASAGTLYLVSTPIGNLEDITFRAIRVLREVHRIACEDTRRTRGLLSHHGVRTPTVAFHRYNEDRVLPSLLREVLAGRDLALVTDGGTPSISDPGFSLVRAAAAAGIAIVPVPGPDAPITALVASGLPAEPFTFFGFLPHRSSERRRLLESIRDRRETLVFFDSPRRVAASLEEMARIFGDRPAAVCREMTKMHEEFLRGGLEGLAARIGMERVRGEITLVVAGASPPAARPAEGAILREEVAREVRGRGISRRDAVRAVAKARGIPRREVYRAIRDSGAEPSEREVTAASDETE